MEVVKILLYVVEIVVCLLLGLVVMIQKPKEGGLGGAFGAVSFSFVSGIFSLAIMPQAMTSTE